MSAKRFTITGNGISDHEKKRLYDLQTVDGFISVCEELNTLDEDLIHELKVSKTLRDVVRELRKENKRLTDKLNNTALELVDNTISQEKAVEISEMNYHEFLEYRKENCKPMELKY